MKIYAGAQMPAIPAGGALWPRRVTLFAMENANLSHYLQGRRNVS